MRKKEINWHFDSASNSNSIGGLRARFHIECHYLVQAYIQRRYQKTWEQEPWCKQCPAHLRSTRRNHRIPFRLFQRVGSSEIDRILRNSCRIGTLLTDTDSLGTVCLYRTRFPNIFRVQRWQGGSSPGRSNVCPPSTCSTLFHCRICLDTFDHKIHITQCSHYCHIISTLHESPIRKGSE